MAHLLGNLYWSCVLAMEFLHKVCCVPGKSIIRIILTFESHATSIPIGVAAIALVLIFLSLATEKQDIKTRIKRIDFVGMSLQCHSFIKSFTKPRMCRMCLGFGCRHITFTRHWFWWPNTYMGFGCCYCEYTLQELLEGRRTAILFFIM